MNLLIPGALLGTLLFPLPLPHVVAADLEPDRIAAAPHPTAVWPLEPRPEVVAGFDPPSAAWSAGHRGVDLLGAAEQPVRAAMGGTVTVAGTIAGRGVVVVSHGTTRTTYEPVQASVHRGDRVRAGAPIGTLQAALSHCAPRICLHWGLIGARGYQDPLGLIRSTRVRLLPLGQARG